MTSGGSVEADVEAETIRNALNVNLALWRDDQEPGDFDRDVIEPTQAALQALTNLTDRIGTLRDELWKTTTAAAEEIGEQAARIHYLEGRVGDIEAAFRKIDAMHHSKATAWDDLTAIADIVDAVLYPGHPNTLSPPMKGPNDA